MAQKAQEIAANARKIEFVGLTLSLITLLLSVFIYCTFRFNTFN